MRDLLVFRSSAGVGGVGFGEMVVVGVQVAEHSGRFAHRLSHALASTPLGGNDMHSLHLWAAAVDQPTWAVGHWVTDQRYGRCRRPRRKYSGAEHQLFHGC